MYQDRLRSLLMENFFKIERDTCFSVSVGACSVKNANAISRTPTFPDISTNLSDLKPKVANAKGIC